MKNINPQRCKISIARRSSTAVLNSGFWPLDDAALLNFATMRIYAICRTESKGFVSMLLQVASLFKVLTFSRWIGTLEQTSDIIQTQFYKMQLLFEIEEYWKIFHAENGPFFFEWFEVLFDVRCGVMAVI